MIHLEKGQKLFENEGMVMYDQTGYYNDDDSVICAMVYAPEEPVCRYEAKFVAYGSNVYNITDPEKLMEEIKKIDPETLFGKKNENVREQQIVDSIQTNVSEDLSVTQDASAALANEKLSSEIAPSTESNTTDPLIVPSTSTSTPNIVTNTNAVATSTATSSSPTLTATSTTTSSSTPPLTVPQIDFSTATTTFTPSTISTSTPTIVSGTSTEPVIEKVIPAIENVIDQLNTISDIVESGTSTVADTTNLTL